MTQAQSAEEKARLKRQWTDLAVKQAQEGLWEEAVATNKNILSLFPTEPDALNRLGKAYTELGSYADARHSYTQTLKVQPGNSIARKNLDRLALLESQAVPVAVHGSAAGRAKSDMFIEETGKTGITDLINLASPAVLTTVSVGDKVQLQVKGHTLFIQGATGDIIGQVEPRLSNRLINFMKHGNRYAAVVIFADGGLIRLRMREVYQHSDMFGRVSFPSQGSGTSDFRADIRGSLLHHDREEEDDLNSDDDYYDRDNESEDLNEFEYENTLDTDE